MFAGSLSLRDHIERQFGFEQIMAQEFPQLEILPVRESRDEVEKTESLTELLLREHKDLVGIYNVGGGTKGIVAGLDASTRAKDIVLIAHEITEGSRRALISPRSPSAPTWLPRRRTTACASWTSAR